MVGHSEPLHVKFTHFNPDNETDEREESAFVHDRKNRKPQDVEIIYENNRMPDGKFEVNDGKFSDSDGRIDFQVHNFIIMIRCEYVRTYCFPRDVRLMNEK